MLESLAQSLALQLPECLALQLPECLGPGCQQPCCAVVVGRCIPFDGVLGHCRF